MPFELLYISSATERMTQQALLNLLETARRNNARTGITGILLFHKDTFMQLLEGEEEAVTSLYQAILDVPRHTRHWLLWNGPVATRSFADWTMAFKMLGDVDPEGIEGYSRLLDEGFTRTFLGSNPSIAQSLMRKLNNLG